MWVAIGAVVGAIGLAFALPFLGGLIDGDAAEVGFYVGVLIGMPAFLLLLPVLILAVVVDHAALRAYPVMPLAASWDVRLDGEVHVVSLPSSQTSSPDHVWVDGARIPLTWTPTGEWRARAVLDAGSLKGTLTVGYDGRALAAGVAVSALLGGGATGGVPVRYGLQVKGGTVEAIPVSDGQRRS